MASDMLTTAAPTIVRLEEVDYFYGTHHALRGISFEVAAGQITGLLGHNGAGKTTTIRLLNGLLRPSAGEVRVFDGDPVRPDGDLRLLTSVVNDALGLPERQSARQAMRFHAELWCLDKTVAEERALELLERFGLGDVVDVPVKAYSRGMRQRLALARSLLHRPRLLLLDEPTLGMDPVGRRDFRSILQELAAEGVAIVMSTHDLGEVERACDEIVILHHGAVMVSGSRTAVLESVEIDVEVTVDFEDGTTSTFVAANRKDIADQVEAITAAGGRIVGVRSAAPTLEDVYVAMHGEEQS